LILSRRHEGTEIRGKSMSLTREQFRLRGAEIGSEEK